MWRQTTTAETKMSSEYLDGFNLSQKNGKRFRAISRRVESLKQTCFRSILTHARQAFLSKPLVAADWSPVRLSVVFKEAVYRCIWKGVHLIRVFSCILGHFTGLTQPDWVFNPLAHCLPAALWWRPTGVSSRYASPKSHHTTLNSNSRL